MQMLNDTDCITWAHLRIKEWKFIMRCILHDDIIVQRMGHAMHFTKREINGRNYLMDSPPSRSDIEGLRCAEGRLQLFAQEAQCRMDEVERIKSDEIALHAIRKLLTGRVL